MSTSSGASSTAARHFVVPFFDPRRWLGTLFAVVGVTLSIVAAILPSSITQRISRPPPSAPFPLRPLRSSRSRRIHPRRPYSSTIQAPVTSVTWRSTRRHTAGDVPLSPHVTFISGPPPRSFSTGSILASSSSSNSSPDPSPSFAPSLLPTSSESQPEHPAPISAPHSAPQLILFPLPPFPPTTVSAQVSHSVALKSLDCLDLATSEFPPPAPHRTWSQCSQCSRRYFRLQLPKLGFGKRTSATDLRADKDLALFGSEGESTTFSTKRCSTVSNCTCSALSQDLSLQSTMPRRKFSLFSRESNVSKDKSREKDPVHLLPPTPTLTPSPDVIPHDPSVTLPNALDHMAPNHPIIAIAGPSTPLSPPLFQSSLPPLVPTQTPPARPSRTDPYKTFGVPVPGSERALAFFKAEKEAREKRARSDHERSSVKDKGGDGVEIVDVRKTNVDGVDEFGFLGGTSPEQQGRRRSWGLARRGSESPRVQEQELKKSPTAKEGKRKKVNDKSVRASSKLRHSLTPPVTRGAGAKELGYASDTGVSSLTYKLM